MKLKRRRSTAMGVLLVILLICLAASLAVLFTRLREFNVKGFENIIPLTEARGETSLTVSSADPPAYAQSPNLQPANTTQQTAPAQDEDSSQATESADPSFVTYDENTVWSTQTDVKIFKMTYDNASGEVTVKPNSGTDKLLAPGTSNEYTFTLENTGNVPLDYTMSMEAWFGSKYVIPVQARVSDYNGNYLLGSAHHAEDVLKLNSVGDSGVLGAGRCAVYTLDWEWVFEQGIDDYDTMLGNLAVDDDITLTIRIITTAVYDDDPDNTDQGLPNPGDDPTNPGTGIIISTGITALLLVGVMLISVVNLFANKQGDDEKEDEA